MQRRILPKQPALFVSYLRVGRLLYYSLILFILESFFFWKIFRQSSFHNEELLSILWLSCFLFSFVHIFLVLMDGWSRFQNYKWAKDQLYIYGFNTKIVAHYKGSKCQRSAMTVAAEELGMGDEIKKFYHQLGIYPYHFIPEFIVKDPFFLFKHSFWSRTFLEKNYCARFNFKELEKAQFATN